MQFIVHKLNYFFVFIHSKLTSSLYKKIEPYTFFKLYENISTGPDVLNVLCMCTFTNSIFHELMCVSRVLCVSAQVLPKTSRWPYLKGGNIGKTFY